MKYEWEKAKWAMGERFGKYGIASNVDIRQLWPSVEVSLLYNEVEAILRNIYVCD